MTGGRVAATQDHLRAKDTPSAKAERLRGFYPRSGKRILDLAIAVPGSLVLAVPAAVVALLIRITDGTPVLFAQLRVGRHGRLFRLLKFRTMTAASRGGTTVTIAGDRRVTQLGAVLRRLKLDELPQLVNVLRGDMSFVGPRPDVPGYLDALDGDDALLLELRPGITGPATLVFRDEEELLSEVEDPVEYNDLVLFPAKVRINLRYVSEITLLGDLRWMALTLLPSAWLRRWLDRRGWLETGRSDRAARATD